MIKRRVKRWLRQVGLLPNPSTSARRIAGNKARDARRWEEASAAYRLHLDLYPTDGPIWVQYGHCLRESSGFNEATAAYQEGARLVPNDSDPWMQLGRLYEQTGQFDEACKAYGQAMRLGHPEAEILALTAKKSASGHVSRPADPGMVLYSVQDMLDYLKVHALFTGIQRVQAGIALHLIDQDNEQTGFVLTDAIGGASPGDFWLLDKQDLKAVIDAVTKNDGDHVALRRLLLQCELNAELVHAENSHTIVLLGAFWGLGNTPERFFKAKRAGARIGAYIYDIIPLSHPQFCEADLTGYFSEHMGPLCAIADFYITISDYTRHTLEAIMRTLNMRPIPMVTVSLAHEMTEKKAVDASWPAVLADVEGKPFVAYISTIEGRKNHIYVVRVWQRLIEMGLAVPDLLFVGRKGWRIMPLLELLEETHNLDGRVHIAHDLSDGELSLIYSKAEFTVFTSTVEGWGLPVGESLMHGTPCVASRCASIPEVGGEFVDYVDPMDIEDGVRVVHRLLFDPGYLVGRKQDIETKFQPKTWQDVARDFSDSVDRFKDKPALPIAKARLDAGQFVNLSFHAAPLDPMQTLRFPRSLMLDRQFYEREHFGSWMEGDGAELRFKTDLLPGTPIVFKIGICTPDRAANFNLTIRLGQDRPTESVVRPMVMTGTDASLPQSLKTVQGFVDADGSCVVSLNLDSEPPDRGSDPRKFLIGIRGFGYAKDTTDGRHALLESILSA